MNKSNPRWLQEIPIPNKITDKRELTEKERQESKTFENAVKNNKINEWFNENK